MPLLGALIQSLFGSLYGIILALQASRYAVALAAVTLLAGMYLAAVGVFTAFVQPLIGSAFSTSFGQVIGLAFPPVAGTVVAGISALWVALVGFRYVSRFAGLLVPR